MNAYKKQAGDRLRARAYPQLPYKVMYNYLRPLRPFTQEAMPCFR